MQCVGVVAILLFAVSGWAQSLGDVVRAEREREKPRAQKVITNENLPAPTAEEQSEPADPLQMDLMHVRSVLRGICSDPQSQNGRILSDADKDALNESVKPLRALVHEVELVRKRYKDEVAALDRDLKAKVMKAVYIERPLTDADIQRVKSIRQEHDTRRAALVQQGERQLEGFKVLQQELESIAKECPAAAATVPD